jgi:hypothetical protein
MSESVGQELGVRGKHDPVEVELDHGHGTNDCRLHTIGHAASQGLMSYEMLGNAADWTAGWTRTLRPFVRVRAYPASWPSARALCADASRAVWARWQSRFGPHQLQAAPT